MQYLNDSSDHPLLMCINNVGNSTAEFIEDVFIKQKIASVIVTIVTTTVRSANIFVVHWFDNIAVSNMIYRIKTYSFARVVFSDPHWWNLSAGNTHPVRAQQDFLDLDECDRPLLMSDLENRDQPLTVADLYDDDDTPFSLYALTGDKSYDYVSKRAGDDETILDLMSDLDSEEDNMDEVESGLWSAYARTRVYA